MPELALAVARIPSAVDWAAWTAARVSCVYVPLHSPREAVEDIAATGMTPVLSFALYRDRPGRSAVNALGEADSRWTTPNEATALPDDIGDVVDLHVSCARYGSHLEDRIGSRWGEAVVGELDAWAASIDLDALRPSPEVGGELAVDELGLALRWYLRARLDGSAPGGLAADADGMRLLLGDQAEKLAIAREAAIRRSIALLATAVRGRGGRLGVELDAVSGERARLGRTYAAVADGVATRLSGCMATMASQARQHVALVGRGAVVSLPVPCETIDGAEALADVLDLLDGIGVARVVLLVDDGWLKVGSTTVARAAYRLTGRPGTMKGQARRAELRPA